jgi:transposase InsO family protein
MQPDSIPLKLLLCVFSSWVNRQQDQIIDYLVEENCVLKEQLKGRRLRLTDSQRRRLAAKAKWLGRSVLSRFATIVAPDTLLAWHRKLIAAKWTYKAKRLGRPGVMKEIRKHIIRMSQGNPSWGYCRIQGALKHIGHGVAPSTIAKVLREHGIQPAPERPTSWRTFIKTHAHVIVGADFFTTEVWTARGLVTYYTLFFIEHGSRVVHIAGSTPNPDGRFMAQIARNLIDCGDGFFLRKRFLIIDRDSKFTKKFKAILEDAGVKTILAPFQAPNANAIAERFVQSIKGECLDQMILFGAGSLERAQREYTEHYLKERPHQGLGNDLIRGAPVTSRGRVEATERLGGLLKFYSRAA